jgi:hypothetical protein
LSILPVVLLVLTTSAFSTAGQAQTPPQADPLKLARERYNAQKYDEAIASAREALAVPATANTAGVVLARAHLERYRDTTREVPDPGDLTAARDALKQVDATTLPPRDQIEFTVGMGELMYLEGQALYLEDRYGTAAEFFLIALRQAEVATPDDTDPLFEWWASALDRQAQFGPDADRKPLYQRLLDGADRYAEWHPRSAAAPYWLAAAARGVGDLDRALAAATAGWLRAPQLGAGGAKLRADLDRLVTQVILKERAQRVPPESDPHQAYEAMKTQWDLLKNQWGGW